MSTVSPAEIVWTGSEDLAHDLRPVDAVRRHPGNPWVGDVEEIRASLRRFGQVRPILVDTDGTIVAGNHTYAAAVAEGWTHIAVSRNTFTSEAEARAYLLADNRLSDVGEYERVELRALVEELATAGRWDGTGYTPDDLEHMRAAEAAAAVPPPAPAPSAPPAPPPPLREVVLLLDDDKFAEVSAALRALRERYALEGVTETVCRAVHDEAKALNQAEAPGG